MSTDNQYADTAFSPSTFETQAPPYSDTSSSFYKASGVIVNAYSPNTGNITAVTYFILGF